MEIARLYPEELELYKSIASGSEDTEMKDK